MRTMFQVLSILVGPMLRTFCILLAAVVFASCAVCAIGQEPADPTRSAISPSVHWLRTASGVDFTILGERHASPASTLLVLATDAMSSLSKQANAECEAILTNRNYLCVSVDLPAHGKQRRSDEPEGLSGWRSRIDAGDDPIAALTEQISNVLDHLIAEGYSDPARIGACGTSRGGFAVMHCAAADPRVRWIVAYAPVTDLKALEEFRGAENSPLVRKLALISQADKLAKRDIWIAIGDRDERVDTDLAIQLARAISGAAAKQAVPSQIELHVCPAIGHRTPEGAATQSAAWISRMVSGK